MIIRKAILEDSDAIATYLLLAMEDIVCEFIGQNDPKKAKEFLLHFVQKENNQYSYQNCFVVEGDHQIIAAVNIYDGSELKRLRAPIIQYIETHFSKVFNPEDETQPGEFYIDSLGVNPNHQGKGIGAKLLQFLIHYYVTQNDKAIGLLVEESNPNAKRLYLKLGFEPVGEKMLVGNKLLHLQVKPKSITS
ncbi:MAG: GNAT family N-acetyltransferase [Gelidibacter sp.]